MKRWRLLWKILWWGVRLLLTAVWAWGLLYANVLLLGMLGSKIGEPKGRNADWAVLLLASTLVWSATVTYCWLLYRWVWQVWGSLRDRLLG